MTSRSENAPSSSPQPSAGEQSAEGLFDVQLAGEHTEFAGQNRGRIVRLGSVTMIIPERSTSLDYHTVKADVISRKQAAISQLTIYDIEVVQGDGELSAPNPSTDPAAAETPDQTSTRHSESQR